MIRDAAVATTTDVLITNARRIDPASGLDTMGGLLVRDGRIVEVGPALGRPEGVEVVDVVLSVN